MLNLFVVTGISGSGKTSALNMLEDLGYYCIDNLPVALINDALSMLAANGYHRIAMSVDARDKESSKSLIPTIDSLQNQYDINGIFLTASTMVLQRRYSETRRRHPFSFQNDITDEKEMPNTIVECIERERALMTKIQEKFLTLDTDKLNTNDLKKVIFELIDGIKTNFSLVVVQSFSYKDGIPIDSDLVFDARCLPNPFYDPKLRDLTGRDTKVIKYLKEKHDVHSFIEDILEYLKNWLPNYMKKERSYLTVSVGCTGGRHRSVYCSEEIAKKAEFFGATVPSLRPPSLAQDDTTTEATLKYALNDFENLNNTRFDLCVFLTCTDIFRSVNWITRAIEKLENDSTLDSVFAADLRRASSPLRPPDRSNGAEKWCRP